MKLRSFHFLIPLLAAATGFCQRTPVPNDPLELATGAVKVADTAPDRARALGLLERARQNTNLHAPAGAPFDLRVSFNSAGDSQYTGAGELEEIWLSPDTWRWSARLGSYAQTRVFYQGEAYDTNPHAYLPLRLQMLRGAIFWPVAGHFAGSLLRVAPSSWNGVPVTCVLISGPGNDPAPTPGRRWEEEEFCVEPKSGLLETYSVAPGIYSIYDYTNALQFHGSKLPRRIGIVENGATVLDAQLDSFQSPGSTDPSLFTPGSDMQGPGVIIRGPIRLTRVIPAPAGASAPNGQPVIVVAALDVAGKVLEAEPLAASDGTLAAAALEGVRSGSYGPAKGPIQREVFVRVQFAPAQ